jgi:hypothetical protein
MFSLFTSLFAKPATPKQPFRPNLAIDYFRMPEGPAPARPVEPIRPGDYFDGSTQRYRAVHPTELLNVHVELVEQIYQATGMDRFQFRRRAYPMLFFAAGFYQLVPASANNHHREPGGLLLHCLQVCRHAVHLGQFARFESDRSVSVSPDDHKAWSIGLMLAALTHDAGKLLTDFRVVHPSFYTPGRLRPRLDNGAPPQDEPAVFVPYNDAVFGWLRRYGYTEYQVHWLENRYGKHDAQSRALINTWTNTLKDIVLPEKVLRTLATTDPRPGAVEADFWEIVNKADRRSATDYFPTVAGNPGAIIVETLRRLVAEGTWRPSPTGYPLCIAENQRLLLRDPVDLSQLANHIANHPQSYVLSAEGPVRVDVLATHFHFESLIEINPAAEARFAPATLAPDGPAPGQRLLILNERLSRELLDLARSAPPAQSPPIPASAPVPVDLRHLAEPVTPQPCAASPAPAAIPASFSSSPTTVPKEGEVPALVTDFLEYLRSLKPHELFAADRARRPRAPKDPQLEDLSCEPGQDGRIVVGRNLVKRFRQRRSESLDTVFSTLIGCRSVVTAVHPEPPRSTERLTLSVPASSAVRRPAVPTHQTASATPTVRPAQSAPAASRPSGPSLSPVSAHGPNGPDERAVALLFRLFAHPPVHEHFLRAGTDYPTSVRFQTLADVLLCAQRETPALAAGLDVDGLARLLVDGGLSIEMVPVGIRLTPAIAPFWLRYMNEVRS